MEAGCRRRAEGRRGAWGAGALGHESCVLRRRIIYKTCRASQGGLPQCGVCKDVLTNEVRVLRTEDPDTVAVRGCLIIV